MAKLDLKKELKHLYFPSSKEPSVVDVPKMNFFMVDGEGDPNVSEWFQRAIEALYGMSFTTKFMLKKGPEAVDFTVMPLEGLWWAEDVGVLGMGMLKECGWTLMIAQPEHVTEEVAALAEEELRRRKDPPALDRLRFEAYNEGLSAQIMHIGPYAEEGPTIQRLHAFIEAEGYRPTGKHHEIYLSDPRRAAPERLKTVIRQPMEGA